MIENRSPLNPWVNYYVTIVGVFEESKNVMDPNKVEYNEYYQQWLPENIINPQNGEIMPIPDPKYLDFLECPLLRHTRSSLLTNIGVAANETTYFSLDHMNLFLDIPSTYFNRNIKYGDTLRMNALIGMYKSRNKSGGYDYCAIDIRNLENLGKLIPGIIKYES